MPSFALESAIVLKANSLAMLQPAVRQMSSGVTAAEACESPSRYTEFMRLAKASRSAGDDIE